MTKSEQAGFLLFNTLSKRKEAFAPEDKERVTMYVCGPTVYDYIHLGNARTAIVYDLLYRLLIYLYGKEKVVYARNITDIDDKIINRAQERKIKTSELASETIHALKEDESYLGCLEPTIEPRATEHVGSMIELIEKLLHNKAAYIAGDHVLFSVRKAGSLYKKLVGRKIEDLLDRQEINSFKKEPGDFVLWKPKKELESEHDVFSSPWGLGRPGWHIECSAMSTKVLGCNFDIHGGGLDLIFPHHSNEIAQSTCAFEGSSYAKFWVHTGFLTCNREKMSKSLGNFVTVRALREQNVSGNALRLFILNTHYRKPLDFSQRALEDAIARSELLQKALSVCKKESERLPEEFLAYLKDDLNTHMCIDYLHRKAAKICEGDTSFSEGFHSCCQFLGIKQEIAVPLEIPSETVSIIESLVGQRRVARNKKDWVASDKIRSQLFKMGVQLKDHPDGSTTWTYRA
jgi:cysteinyl-tRNA synthetase